MLMTVLMNDVDTKLRTTGVPTNTWSIGRPVYDIEYADDTMIISVTRSQAEEMLKAIQVEATLYGLTVNTEKTELLSDYTADQPIHFVDGTPVKEVTQAKYLGSQVSWVAPTRTAIDARKAQAQIAYAKLQHLWRSRLSRKEKVRIFLACILPVLVYGLGVLTLELKHLKTVDAFFHRFLRRSMGIRASYYSRIANARVWKLADRPVLPAQLLIKQQLKQLTQLLVTPPHNPLRHVVFSPGWKDRIKFTKGVRRGHPQRYWLERTEAHATKILKHHPLDRKDLLGLKQHLEKHPTFALYLETAPTRHTELFTTFAKSLGCAWQPLKKKP